MPAVDVAMVRSLRGGIWENIVDSVARSLTAEVVRRDLAADAGNKVSEIKQTFSSWDGCMAHVYCKWPAIAIMVVGGLILISLISRKHLDEPYNPQQSGYGGYRQEAPMAVNVPAPAPVPAFAPAASHGPPQYAEFDVSKQNADALPAMPSWESANSKKIVLEEEVEMDDLSPKKEPAPQQTQAINSPRYGGPQQQRGPQQQQGPMGRTDPYNRQQNNSPGFNNSYGQQPANPYGGHDQGYAAHDQGYPAQDQGYATQGLGYGAQGQGYGAHDQVYGAHDQGYNAHDQGYNGDRAYGAHEQPYGGHVQGYGGGHDQAFGGHDQGLSGHQQGYGAQDVNYNGHDQGYNSHMADGYGAHQPYDHAAPAASMMSPGHQSPTSSQNGFGVPRQMTPGPAHMPTAPQELDGHTSPDAYGVDPHMRKSPGPGLNQRASPAPPNDFAIAPQNKPVPFRTYTQAPPKALQEPPQSPIVNNSGFDFSSGYSRPQHQEGPNYDRRPSESHEREDNEGYPGYKPYSPSPQNWSGV
ncbi:hypothetical protein TgHK011_006517 [Trichoderma gracile]|nr:hypothetical protein TgHK011_006517 [Trichoderma gracile]